MKELKRKTKVGQRTADLENLARNLILKSGGKCAFLGYQNFPACLCTSINEEIVHVPPSNRVIKDGDLLKLDLGICWKGYYLDMAITFQVGRKTPLAQKLIAVGKKALKIGIKNLKVGNEIKNIGTAIQKYVESQNFNVIRELAGHGIGKKLHEDPKIPNFKDESLKEKIKEGMVVCIEPMISAGNWKLKKTEDGFGFKTIDNSLTCHFEQTIAVTKKGPKILTKI
jgi:methionyl aminopeptidase